MTTTEKSVADYSSKHGKKMGRILQRTLLKREYEEYVKLKLSEFSSSEQPKLKLNKKERITVLAQILYTKLSLAEHGESY